MHELRPHVLHLMRGQIFEIDGKKIFTFGGASSHDITGGILETDYLEFIKNYTNYKKWFFGHYHDNRNISDKEILIYEQMIRIS